MSTRAAWLVLLALGGAAVAQPKGKPVPPPPPSFEEGMMLRFHMHENFGLLHAIERDLLVNRLDAARDLASAIAQTPDEPGSAPFAKAVAQVRERAAAVAAAKTVEAALRAEATLAAACASCHVDTNARPEFAKWPPLPPDQPGQGQAAITARMMRHLWAADRLWEGMLGDADESWKAGLDVLASAPLPAVDLGKARAPFATALQRNAKAARARTLDLPTRAQIYGELLVTCAGCHAAPAKP